MVLSPMPSRNSMSIFAQRRLEHPHPPLKKSQPQGPRGRASEPRQGRLGVPRDLPHPPGPPAPPPPPRGRGAGSFLHNDGFRNPMRGGVQDTLSTLLPFPYPPTESRRVRPPVPHPRVPPPTLLRFHSDTVTGPTGSPPDAPTSFSTLPRRGPTPAIDAPQNTPTAFSNG